MWSFCEIGERERCLSCFGVNEPVETLDAMSSVSGGRNEGSEGRGILDFEGEADLALLSGISTGGEGEDRSSTERRFERSSMEYDVNEGEVKQQEKQK